MEDMSRINGIDDFCGRLAAAWKKYPSLRFGQMVVCIFGEIAEMGEDPFFLEDDRMIKFIEDCIAENISEKE